MSNWVIFGIFAGGYIARHLAGIWYARIFKPIKSEPILIDPQDVTDSVMSHDRGKTWHIRTKAGAWVKASRSTIQKILDFYDTNQPTIDNEHPYPASTPEGER